MARFDDFTFRVTYTIVLKSNFVQCIAKYDHQYLMFRMRYIRKNVFSKKMKIDISINKHSVIEKSSLLRNSKIHCIVIYDFNAVTFEKIVFV